MRFKGTKAKESAKAARYEFDAEAVEGSTLRSPDGGEVIHMNTYKKK